MNFVNCVQNGLLFFGYFDGRRRVGERVAKRGIVTRIVGEKSSQKEFLPKQWVKKQAKKSSCPSTGRKSKPRRIPAQSMGKEASSKEFLPRQWVKVPRKIKNCPFWADN